MKYILMNGPAGAGKDTFASMLMIAMHKYRARIQYISLADPIRDFVVQVLEAKGYTDYDARQIIVDRNTKDEPFSCLNGFSPRMLGIEYAERFIKPTLGKDFFVQAMMNKANLYPFNDVIVPDLGFNEELDYLLENLQEEDEIFIVFIARQGYTWNESRINLFDRVEQEGIPHKIIWNDGTRDELKEKAEQLAKELYDEN